MISRRNVSNAELKVGSGKWQIKILTPPSFVKGKLGGTSDTERQKQLFLAYLNNAESGAQYIGKLQVPQQHVGSSTVLLYLHGTVSGGVVDRHRFDAHPDPNSCVDADPDPERHQNDADSVPRFYTCWKIRFIFSYIHISVSPHWFIFLVNVVDW